MRKRLYLSKKDVYFYIVMYYRHIGAIIFLQLCFIGIQTTAQPHYSRMETYGTRDGMLSSKIYSLLQTKDRKLWIGTELGISVYDGYEFVNYQYTQSNEPIGRIRCMAQDSLGTVWLGGDKGLFRFTNKQLHKTVFGNYTALTPEALVVDKRGNLWIGCLEGLYSANVTSIKNTDKPDISIFNAERIYSLSTDQKRNIYYSTAFTISILNPDKKEISVLWKNPDAAKPVLSLAVISPDTLAWNCLNSHPMQMIRGTISSRFTEDYIGTAVFKYQQKIYSLTTGWLGELDNGYSKPLAVFGKATNNAVTAMIDLEENIWIGSWEGLLKFRRSGFSVYQTPSNAPKETFSFLEKKNGQLLFGSNRGILYTNKDNKLIVDKSYPVLFQLAEVMCMYEDSKGALWAGSGYQGISRFKNGKLSNWNKTGFLKDNNCRALFSTDENQLYACTENGLTLINPLLDEPFTKHYPFEKELTRLPELIGCFKANDTALLFYSNQGLYKISNQILIEETIENMPVKSLYINKIVRDKKGNVWIATLGKGLLKCKLAGQKLALLKQYDSKNGLPSDIALTVLVDKNDNVWIGDYMSISVIQQTTPEQIITYNENDGLIGSYYQTVKLEQEKKGRIWGLTTMGTFSFHPDSVSNNKQPPVLLINAVHTKGKEYQFYPDATAIFRSDENSVSFHFTAVSLTEPGKIQYAYRLSSTDTSWTFTKNRTVSFNSLQPGIYTFELKACNNSGVWTKGSLYFNFRILAPFWQTWWFLIALSVLIAGFIGLIVRRRIMAIKNKALLRQQMSELESKALRAQMNPHFIFNSLNAIQELIVTGTIDQAYQYLSEFSKLLRLVLNNSEKNFIPLTSELEMIRLQLSLESLRFKNAFNYSIETDSISEPEMMNIPPLLLQPYVENAIWHGLRHKEGEKNLWIRIKEREGRLIVEIEDNGVGRKKADEIKKQKLGALQFESKGSALSQQRLKLLNEQYPDTTNVLITDNFTENNQAAGTIVTISLPANLQ